MKNWIIVLLIFIMPLSLYAYLDAKTLDKQTCQNEVVDNEKIKIIKFSSPMCSECKEMAVELDKTMKNFKDSVVIEEINVSENVGKSHAYNKNAIKKYKITLVPTVVFLDKQGKTVKRQEGLMTEKEITEVLNGMIENANTIK